MSQKKRSSSCAADVPRAWRDEAGVACRSVNEGLVIPFFRYYLPEGYGEWLMNFKQSLYDHICALENSWI